MSQIKTVAKYLAVASSFLVLTVAFVNCSGNSPQSSPGGATSDDTGKSGLVSAWNAPVGELIQGATLYDGWEDLREIPTPVNIAGGWTDSVAVTSDGKGLLFAYTTIDYPTFHDSLTTGTPIFNFIGPKRTGMTGGHFKMFRGDLGLGGWTVAFQPFNGSPSQHEASASTNVAQDVVVFTRFDSNSIGDIYYTLKSGGVWSTPVAFPSSPKINTACKEDNPFVVGSLSEGATIYFESNRVDLAATSCDNSGHNNHIYYTVYSPAGGGSFSAVQKVSGINGTANGDDDTQVFISPDKSKAFWTALRVGTAYGVFTADLVGGTYVNVRQLVKPNFGSPFAGKLALIGEANVAEVSEGLIMYMMCGIAGNEANNKASEITLKICRARKPR